LFDLGVAGDRPPPYGPEGLPYEPEAARDRPPPYGPEDCGGQAPAPRAKRIRC